MQTSRVLPLWLFPLDSPQKEISLNELKAAELLSKKRSIEYKYARGNARYALSELFKIKAIDIPLNSLPGEAPSLGNNLGLFDRDNLVKNMKCDPKWVHVARYELILKQVRAVWLRIIFKPLPTPKKL